MADKRVRITSTSEVDLLRGNVLVAAGSTVEQEVDEYEIYLIDAHPDLSVELLDGGESSDEEDAAGDEGGEEAEAESDDTLQQGEAQVQAQESLGALDSEGRPVVSEGV